MVQLVDYLGLLYYGQYDRYFVGKITNSIPPNFIESDNKVSQLVRHRKYCPHCKSYFQK